jgi:NADP-dependent 3-hydroxy acid dehydrogenase YdfG
MTISIQGTALIAGVSSGIGAVYADRLAAPPRVQTGRALDVSDVAA